FSSLGCALAPNFVYLLIARSCQAVGTSMLMCLIGGLVRNTYPARMMGFGISLNALTVGLTLVIGPSIGAFILQYGTWQWIFLSYVPLCIAAAVGTKSLPETPRVKR